MRLTAPISPWRMLYSGLSSRSLNGRGEYDKRARASNFYSCTTRRGSCERTGHLRRWGHDVRSERASCEVQSLSGSTSGTTGELNGTTCRTHNLCETDNVSRDVGSISGLVKSKRAADDYGTRCTIPRCATAWKLKKHVSKYVYDKRSSGSVSEWLSANSGTQAISVGPVEYHSTVFAFGLSTLTWSVLECRNFGGGYYAVR